VIGHCFDLGDAFIGLVPMDMGLVTLTIWRIVNTKAGVAYLGFRDMYLWSHRPFSL